MHYAPIDYCKLLKNNALFHCWALAALALLVPSLALAQSQSGLSPQLGKAPPKEILAALTSKARTKLVVGRGFYPAGFPGGILPARAPDDRKVPEKIPGAAGRTHAIARWGISSLTPSGGPAGVRTDPIRGQASSKTYCATAFPVAARPTWHPSTLPPKRG